MTADISSTLEIKSIKMPDLFTVGVPEGLSHGEWERVGRVFAEVERDSESGRYALRFPEGISDDRKCVMMREEIESRIVAKMHCSGLDMKHWIIQASLIELDGDPEAMDRWEVRAQWTLRKSTMPPTMRHRPTISEKTQPRDSGSGNGPGAHEAPGRFKKEEE